MAIRISGLNSGLDTDSIVQELVSAYSLKTEKYEKEKTKLEWKQDAWKSLNTKIYSLYTNMSNLQYSSAYNMKKTTVSNSTKATVTASGNAVTGTQKLNVLQTAQTAYLTSGKLKLATPSNGEKVTKNSTLESLGYTGDETEISLGDGKNITVSKDTTVSQVITKLKEAGVNASFDENNERIFISAKESGSASDFDLTALDTNGDLALSALGFGIIHQPGEELGDNDEDSIAYKVNGSDAQIRLNGALYTSSSNDFSINGLSITAQEVTGDGTANEISITTSVDTQGIYDKIKDFLSEYNTVINEITKLYNAESAGDYQPLTDDEKEAMSDDEIEKWETKIKDSLLRRDSTLSSIMSTMTNTMAQSIEINGKKLSLSSYGIQTLGYLYAADDEHYAYHIDGDEDDSNSSGKTDKLMAAIQENSDEVCEFMKALTGNLYKALDKRMKSTTMSSAYKVYNDKEMDSQLREYESLISKWEEKVSKKEEYYYDKFAAMETALSKINSQSSSLSGLFGM